jgi:hypothetical protein
MRLRKWTNVPDVQNKEAATEYAAASEVLNEIGE